ncbi:importin subunit alpha-8-like, putative, partial [Bodo saltans]
MCLLRKSLAESDTPPPIDAVLDSGIMPLIVEYLNPAACGNTPEVLHEASWALLNVMSGDDTQTVRAIETPHTVEATMALLSNSSVPCRTREHAAWALANIAGTGDSFRSALLLQGAFPLLMAYLHDCVRESFSLENAIWSIGNFVRPLLNIKVDTVPYLSHIPSMITCVLASKNAHKDAEQLLWVIGFLIRDTVDECLQQGILVPIMEFMTLVASALDAADKTSFQLLVLAWLTVVVDISAGDDEATMLLTGVVPIICKAFFVITQHLVPENPKQWLPAANCALLALSNITAIPDGAATILRDFPEGLVACLHAYAEKYMACYHDSGSDTAVARLLSASVKEAVFLLCNLIVKISDDPMRALMYCALSPIVENTQRPSSWVSHDCWRDATQKCLEA